jgi:hypothetical protein
VRLTTLAFQMSLMENEASNSNRQPVIGVAVVLRMATLAPKPLPQSLVTAKVTATGVVEGARRSSS